MKLRILFTNFHREVALLLLLLAAMGEKSKYHPEGLGLLMGWESQRLPLSESDSSVVRTGSTPKCDSLSSGTNPVHWCLMPESISLGHGRGQKLHKGWVLSGS